MSKVYVIARVGREVIKKVTLPLEKLESVALSQNINTSELTANRALLREGNKAFLKLVMAKNGVISKLEIQPLYKEVY